MNTNMDNPTTPTKQYELDALVTRISQNYSREYWTEFLRDVLIPSEMVPAIMTNRPELLRLMQPRPFTVEESKAMIELVAALIETNMHLQQHARDLAVLVGEWNRAFKGLQTIGRRIDHFANFRRSDDDGGADEG